MNLLTHLAEVEREQALAEVDGAADERWKAEALEFIRDYLLDHSEMHVDELWDEGLPVPEEGRWLGAVMRRAQSEGWMEHKKTVDGDFIARPSKNSRMQLKSVWRSLIKEPRP